MNNEVLIISFSFEQEPETIVRLKEAGLNPIVWKAEDRKDATEDDLIKYYQALPKKPSGIIMGADIKVTNRFFEAAPEIEEISLNCAGYDHIDLESAKKHHVTVMNVPRHNFDAVADLDMGLILSAMRNIVKGDKAIRSGVWNKGVERSMAVTGKTLGIIGFGAIGRALAQRASGFEMKKIAYDPFPNEERAKQLGVTYVSLDELYAQSDVIVLACNLTADNYHMINESAISKMKNSVTLVNAARGGLIDMDALYRALKEKTIACAALDAFETEPLLDSPLFDLDNVVLTPHIGGLADKQIHDVAMGSVENYISFYKDPEHCENVLTKE